MKKIALLLLAGSLATFASAQKTYLLRMHLKQGEVFRYAVNAQTMGVTIDMTMAQKVVKVEGNKFTVNTTLGSAKLNGKPLPPAQAAQFQKMLVTTVSDERGRVLSTKTTGIPMGGGAQNATIPFPAEPVAVGKSWSGKGNVNGTNITTTYKLTAVKMVGGTRVAVIESLPQGIPGMKLSAPITISVDLARGIPVSMLMVGSLTQGGQTFVNRVSMRRL